MHIIGDIKGCTGFNAQRLFCKFQVKVGQNWTLINGIDSGETYEEVMDDIDKFAVWDHPIDLHYKCKAVRGWPKF